MEEKSFFENIRIAYFSMEIGIDDRIPTYSGGLGVLAGDTLRSAADLGIPMVGVSLLYKKGYFKQRITKKGEQIEEEVVWEPSKFLKQLDTKVMVKIRERVVWIKPWLYTIKGTTGKELPIIFMDTDIAENTPYDRTLTHYLYGYDEEYRLCQEVVLGIGGVRMLEKIGCKNIKKYHMNEGHSGLLAIELCRRYGKRDDCIEKVREQCVFTTHTPVPAGHDQFNKNFAIDILGENLPEWLYNKVFFEDRLNMTYLGLIFSKYINGVAKKHGEVARGMFPGYHIESITNGVHTAFWASPYMKQLFEKYIPECLCDPFNLRYIMSVPKKEVWDAHKKAKAELIRFVNENYNVGMDEEVFTIGFARRAATYKRGDLLFSDIGRLIRIAEKTKGLQIIYSGKAHPKDTGGKEVIRRIIEAMQQLENKIKACYIEDYSIKIAKLLVAGVDLWVNTPQRPMEASGTSGMKAAINGVPQFSTLDGWWLEGHIENVTGWSIGIHPNQKKESEQAEDVLDFYRKLEHVILPKYYNERDNWIEIMRHVIALNGSFFNTHRMLQQYVLNAYFK
ncbi:MAG: alpha-glucan family phosphorylase [Candidatus Woesearchaeota archaeon]